MKEQTAPIIQVDALSYQFEKNIVLRELSFSVDRGVFLSVIGPNGSGKTTLMRTMYGWLKPAGKTVFIEGKDVTGYSASGLARGVAHVAQASPAEAAFTVEETVLMGRSPHWRFFAREGQADRDKVEEALRATDILPLRDRVITTLSGGELKRVMIASALAQDTRILLLDEPTAHLDLHHEQGILSLLKKMQKEKGITIVAVFHDLNNAAEYSDRILLLKEGKIITTGSPETVITEEKIKDTYNIDVLVMSHPQSGRPCVLHK